MARATTTETLQERAAELDLLLAAVDEGRAGRGRAVIVEGPPGIGKTRVLDELCMRASDTALVLRARGGEQERDVVHLATRELFSPYLRSAGAEAAGRAFAGAASLCGPLLGRSDGGQTTSIDSGFALVHSLYWLVANLAEEAPVVLVVDDAHWVDVGTQRWLAYLLPRLPELRVVLVLAARPRELDPASPLAVGLASVADLEVVRLSPLGPAAAAEVVRAAAPGASDELCSAAFAATGGNPLLLHRLGLEARDHAPGGGGGLGTDQLAELGAHGLGRIVLPRLHVLGPEAVALAQAVAVLGDGCALAEAGATVGLDVGAAATAHQALVRRELLRDQEHPTFVHPLVRALVAGELSTTERSGLHRAAAAVLHERGAPADRIARHLAATEPSGEPWAVRALFDAATEAGARGAPDAAFDLLQTLVREDLDAATRSRALLMAGWYAFRCADPRGLGCLEEALAGAPDPATAVRAWLAVWNWRLVVGTGHDPATVLDGLPEELDAESALTVLGNFTLDLGFTGAGLRRQRDLYRGPSEDPDGSTAAGRVWLSAQAMDEVLKAGDRQRALHCAQRAFADGRVLEESGDSPFPAWIFVAEIAAGAIDEAEAQARRSEDHARARGSLYPAEWCRGTAAMCQLARGDLRSAEATLASGLETTEFLSAPVVRPTWAAVTALVHLGRGRPEEAEATLARDGYLTADPPADFHGAVLLHARGVIHLAAGRVDVALRDFTASGRVLEGFDARSSAFTPWRSSAATCLALLDERDEARALAEEQLVDARRWGAPAFLGASLRGLGTVVGGDAGIAHLEEAVSVLGPSPLRGDHIAALTDLGRLLRLTGRRTAARTPLLEALDLAVRAGATLLAEQAEAELRLAGARPRRRAVFGVDSLTPAELRAAQLAAEGLSNPEIAQSLFVTRKTVEKHLGAVFAKLQISSRDQLAVVLHR